MNRDNSIVKFQLIDTGNPSLMIERLPTVSSIASAERNRRNKTLGTASHELAVLNIALPAPYMGRMGLNTSTDPNTQVTQFRRFPRQ